MIVEFDSREYIKITESTEVMHKIIENRLIRIGIIGGMGPETSSLFTLSIIQKFRRIGKVLPDIIVQHIPLSLDAERDLIEGKASQEHFRLLLDAARSLSRMDVDYIVIPCNTAHVFLPELTRRISTPFLSITKETASQCNHLGFSKVGILGSSTTIQHKLIESELLHQGIKSIVPTFLEQELLNRIIIKIIHNEATLEDKGKLLDIIERMGQQGAQAIVLGCSDLPLLVTQNDCEMVLIDSCSILEDATVRHLGNVEIRG